MTNDVDNAVFVSLEDIERHISSKPSGSRALTESALASLSALGPDGLRQLVEIADQRWTAARQIVLATAEILRRQSKQLEAARETSRAARVLAIEALGLGDQQPDLSVRDPAQIVEGIFRRAMHLAGVEDDHDISAGP